MSIISTAHILIKKLPSWVGFPCRNFQETPQGETNASYSWIATNVCGWSEVYFRWMRMLERACLLRKGCEGRSHTPTVQRAWTDGASPSIITQGWVDRSVVPCGTGGLTSLVLKRLARGMKTSTIYLGSVPPGNGLLNASNPATTRCH